MQQIVTARDSRTIGAPLRKTLRAAGISNAEAFGADEARGPVGAAASMLSGIDIGIDINVQILPVVWSPVPLCG